MHHINQARKSTQSSWMVIVRFLQSSYGDNKKKKNFKGVVALTFDDIYIFFFFFFSLLSVKF